MPTRPAGWTTHLAAAVGIAAALSVGAPAPAQQQEEAPAPPPLSLPAAPDVPEPATDAPGISPALGTWEGEVVADDRAWPIRLHVYSPSTSRIDVPDYGIFGLRLTGTVRSRTAVSFVLPGGGRFNADLRLRRGGEAGMRGLWSGWVRDGEAELERTASRARVFNQWAIEFEADGVTLSGTLLAPEEAKRPPVVVIPPQLEGEARGTPTYSGRAFMLAHRGTAAFVWDSRGTGGSEGEPEARTLGTLAAETEAALRAVAAHPAINPGRIGLWGVGDAGIAGAMGAARSGVTIDRLALVSVPGVTPGEARVWSALREMELEGYSGADRASAAELIGRVHRHLLSGEDREATAAALDAARERPWFRFWPVRAALGLSGSELPEVPPAGAADLATDPVGPVGRLRVGEALAIWGARDDTLPAARSAERLGPALERAAPGAVTTRVLEEADHWMMRPGPADGAWDWPRMSEAYRDTVRRFFMWEAMDGAGASPGAD